MFIRPNSSRFCVTMYILLRTLVLVLSFILANLHLINKMFFDIPHLKCLMDFRSRVSRWWRLMRACHISKKMKLEVCEEDEELSKNVQQQLLSALATPLEEASLGRPTLLTKASSCMTTFVEVFYPSSSQSESPTTRQGEPQTKARQKDESSQAVFKIFY